MVGTSDDVSLVQAQVAKMALFARFARWLPWHLRDSSPAAIAIARLDWICTSFVDSVLGNGYSGSLKQKLTASSAVLFLNDASSSTAEL